MKKLCVTASLLLAAIGVSADPITPQRAMQIAQEYMVEGYTMNLAVKAKARHATAASAISAPYYVISRGENQGYVIVAGDDCLPEILGYTESGNFDSSNLPPALQGMLDGWQEMVEQAQVDGSNTALASARKAQRKVASARMDIAPFVTAHWHQSSPYNDNCPTLTKNGNRALTGCVATAASQILYYWRKDLPATLQASTPTYGYGDAPVTRSVPKGTALKWDLMKDSYSSESQDYKQAVAEFVFATGAATWLTYGESTSGNIEKIPYTFSTYYGMNGGTVHYRDSYNQEGWSQLLYNELLKGLPVMYTGVHPSNGGHAVFVHGYKASNDLFYFNFGWGEGNGYDGYYTTNQTNGMNGFNGYQSALIGAYPKQWNLKVDLLPPSHVYTNVDNKFTIKVTNNSTLDYSGLYLYASTSSGAPSGSAKSKDTETVIATGESVELTLTARPTSERTWYITIADENKNVLAKMPVEVESKTSELHLQDISVSGSCDYKMLNDEAYMVVYNNKTTATATLYDAASYGYNTSLRMFFDVYDEATGQWETIGYKTGDLALVGSESGVATFSLSGTSSCPFEIGKYYKGYLANPVHQTTDMIELDHNIQNEVRFYYSGSDMSVVSFEDNCLALQGHFDNTLFNSSTYAKKTAYQTATIYDLTQCTSVGEVDQTVNPNALIYVADDSKATGLNIVRAGQCAHLVLSVGYNFAPRASFVAEQAQLTIGATTARWQMVTMPFSAQLPDGMVAREILAHTTLGISSTTMVDVQTLEAGKTYFIMTTSADNVTISAANVQVLAQPVANADEAVVGTFVSTATPAKAQLLNNEEKQYFVPVDEGTAVEALRGYWHADNLTKTFRIYPDMSKDPAYVQLAESINSAYSILEKYRATSTDAAYPAYAMKIHEAEKEFSHRGEETALTTASLIKKYATDLLEAGNTYMKTLGDTKSCEIDFTSNIVNPSFEKKNASGWTVGKREGVTTVSTVKDGTKFDVYRSVGMDGTYMFQSLIAADSTSVSLTQVVEGLPQGYYRLTAMLGTDDHSSVTLFADDMTATVEGHPFGHYYLTEAVIDSIKVLAEEGQTTGSLTIGVQEGRWYKADNFTLTCIEAIPVDDIANCINELDADTKTFKEGIYTLQGVRLSSITQSGFYIVDGKKKYIQR
ncbi:MAG: C10 family peptidase [Bacteroidaceae bacterium]|nr:C10 family peptidase [Bacteroidaceae bacterium]